jgi:type I restriction enzyme, S subunit
MMDFTQYEKYKDSGLDWLDEIPNDWEIKRIKDVIKSVGSGTTPHTGNQAYYENGDVNWVNTGDLNDSIIENCSNKITQKALTDFTVLKLYEEGTLLVAMYGATIGKIALLNIRATTNQACCCLNFNKIANNKFIFYWFLSSKPYILSLSVGGGQPNINQKIILNLTALIPNIQTQVAIAGYLDKNTVQIDKKIEFLQAKKERYQDLRTTIINEALTKGLDKTIEMKNSGVEWIGNIPKHWNVKRVKDLFKLVTDVAPNDNDYQLLSIYTSIGVRPRAELEQRGNKSVTTDGYWIVRRGDFIVNKLLAWMGAIALSDYDGVTSPAYDILRKKVPLVQKYYEYLFRTEMAQAEFKRNSRGIMEVRLRLYFDKFGAISVPVQCLEEQQQIADYLDEKTRKIGAIIAKIDENIAALNEFRKTLINDAVTGKIKVA